MLISLKLINYIERKGSFLYIDLGLSGIGSTFVKYNLNPLSKSNTFQNMMPFKRALNELERLKMECNNDMTINF